MKERIEELTARIWLQAARLKFWVTFLETHPPDIPFPTACGTEVIEPDNTEADIAAKKINQIKLEMMKLEAEVEGLRRPEKAPESSSSVV